MYEEKSSSSVTIGSGLVIWAFLACLGYFVYGGINGALAIFVLGVALSLSMLLAIIPFVGPFIWWGASRWLMVQIFTLTGITATLLTLVMWWVSLVGVIIINLLVDVMVAKSW